MKNILTTQLIFENSIKQGKYKMNMGLGWSKISLLFIAILMSSCYSSKNLDYLQSEQSKYFSTIITTEYLVQPNDVLDIKVQSMDPEQVAFFNLDNIDNRRQNANPASMYLTGYSINREGNIRMAMVGDVKVSGLTVEEIRDIIQHEIDKLLLNATVSVKLTSFKVSVLGDVKDPGTYYVFNAQSTIFEALSKAGDLNISAKRRNVKLIRQEGNRNTVINLDLTDPSIIRSPYYLLHPNDVIYVETSKQNIVRNNLSIFSIMLSAIATTLLVFEVTSNN